MRALFPAIVLATILAGCTQTPTPPGEPTERFATEDVERSTTDGALALRMRIVKVGDVFGAGANATIEVSSSKAIEDVRAGITTGAGLRADRAFWSGDLAANVPVTVSTVFRADNPGNWTVRGWAEAWDGGKRLLAAEEVYLGGDGTRAGVREFGAGAVVKPDVELTVAKTEAGVSTLVGRVTLPADSGTTHVRLALDGPLTLDEGDAAWRGAMSEGEPRTFEWSIRATGPGTATLTVYPDASLSARSGEATARVG
ncbi:MAG TPA: hypothetical protein VI997_09075 [Candidatus Thermoplasmatota archaeon]|nr:hypothetical protein [Candidatus Thermoplasmatota archaeon]